MCEQDRQGPWSHAAYNVVKGVKQQKGNQKKKKNVLNHRIISHKGIK